MQSRGGSRSTNNSSNQNQLSSRSVPTRTTYGSVAFSCSNIQCSSPSATHISYAGNNSLEGVFGSHPNAVCQICLTTGHTATGCPNCYLPQQQSTPVQAYATFNAFDANESVWYPDSATASHVTPNEGNFLSNSP